MAVQEILLLGNPLLLERCAPVQPDETAAMREVIADLHDTLFAFRARHGVGRAIAAPQIGVLKRVVYMNVGEPVALLNPEFLHLSPETFALWDDCMSFPDLLVRVRRHSSVALRFRDLEWREHTWQLEGDLSELLQHELDHLDGVLAVARAVDGNAFALRSQQHLLDGTLVATPEETAMRRTTTTESSSGV
jgi:peptide deformylase